MISPKFEHYTCMVNVLGLAGHLHEVENMLKMMLNKYSMLGTCRISNNVEMGERVGKQVLELELGNAMGYVLVLNICASIGNIHLFKNIELQRKERGQFTFTLD